MVFAQPSCKKTLQTVELLRKMLRHQWQLLPMTRYDRPTSCHQERHRKQHGFVFIVNKFCFRLFFLVNTIWLSILFWPLESVSASPSQLVSRCSSFTPSERVSKVVSYAEVFSCVECNNTGCIWEVGMNRPVDDNKRGMRRVLMSKSTSDKIWSWSLIYRNP